MRQRSVMWRWFAFVGLLVALSFALLSFAEEAHAKAKNSPEGRESGGGASEEAAKPVEDALRGVDERGAGDKDPVGNALRGGAAEPARDGKDSGGKGHGEGAAEPAGKAPEADGITSLADAEPVTREADRALNEQAGPVRPVAEKTAEPPTERTIGPLVESAKEATDPLVAPVREVAAEPVLKATDDPVEPLLEEPVAPVVGHVLGEAASVGGTVLDAAAPVAEPILKEATPLVKPILEEAAPVVDTVLGEAPSVAEPVLGAASPVLEPVLDMAVPVAERPFEETAPITGSTPETFGLVSEPVFEGVAPVVADAVAEPLLGMSPPAVESVFEPVARSFEANQAAAGPVLGKVPPAEGVVPAALWPAVEGIATDATDPSHVAYPFSASGVEVALSTHSVEEEGASSRTSSGLSGSLPRLFDHSLFGGSLAALASAAATAMKDALGGNGGTPLQPFGFPSSASPAGSSFGGSGTGIGFDLLFGLALLYALSRRGGSSVCPREVFRLVSSPRLVIELPG